MTDWQRPNVEAPLIVWEYVEAVERIADKREAERQQAQEDLQHRDAQIQELCDELREAIDQRRQAIDALREARELAGEAMGYVAEWATKKWLMRERLEDIDATLVKLGEKP